MLLSISYMTMPPSMVRTWPVIYPPSGPARNATALAISSGSPKRPRGIFWRTLAFTASESPTVRAFGARVNEFAVQVARERAAKS